MLSGAVKICWCHVIWNICGYSLLPREGGWTWMAEVCWWLQGVWWRPNLSSSIWICRTPTLLMLNTEIYLSFWKCLPRSIAILHSTSTCFYVKCLVDQPGKCRADKAHRSDFVIKFFKISISSYKELLFMIVLTILFRILER